MWRVVCVVALWCAVGTPAVAGDVKVAVVSSFLDAMTAIAEEFQKATGHRALMNDGSTGELYAQILNQAPFEVFLSSDEMDAKSLEDDGFAVRGSRFTYAIGRLTLWSRDPNRIGSDGLEILKARSFTQVAIANPRTAAYGHAAAEAMKALGVWDSLEGRLVEAPNSRQAFQLVASGKAELGLVPLAEVLDPDLIEKGSRWDISPDLHHPIRQDAVLLTIGRTNPAAVALMEFLRGAKAKAVIERFGFGQP